MNQVGVGGQDVVSSSDPQLDVFRRRHLLESLHRVAQVRQATPRRLLHPLRRVAVAVEAYPAVSLPHIAAGGLCRHQRALGAQRQSVSEDMPPQQRVPAIPARTHALSSLVLPFINA